MRLLLHSSHQPQRRLTIESSQHSVEFGTPPTNRLLVMACSAAKKKDAGLLPALARYDGPAFHVLRKYLAHATDAPTVFILSARFGLLDADHPIPDYDRRISAEAAEAIRPDVFVFSMNGSGSGNTAKSRYASGTTTRRPSKVTNRSSPRARP